MGRRDGCDLPYVREECLTEDLATFLEALRIPEEALVAIKAMMIEMSKFENSQATERITALDREMSDLTGRLGRQYEDKLAGEISPGTYATLREKYEIQQIDAEQRRAALQAAGSKWRDSAERVFELCASAPDRFKQGDHEARREILKIMCSNCIYDGTSLTITPAKTFDLILKANQEASESGAEIAENEKWWRLGGSNP